MDLRKHLPTSVSLPKWKNWTWREQITLVPCDFLTKYKETKPTQKDLLYNFFTLRIISTLSNEQSSNQFPTSRIISINFFIVFIYPRLNWTWCSIPSYLILIQTLSLSFAFPMTMNWNYLSWLITLIINFNYRMISGRETWGTNGIYLLVIIFSQFENMRSLNSFMPRRSVCLSSVFFHSLVKCVIWKANTA